MARGSLALVLEFHHPMPGRGEVWAGAWGRSAARLYWPAIRTLMSAGETGLSELLTLAVSPAWTALAGDPAARSATQHELDRLADDASRDDAPRWHALRQFVVDRWAADPVAAVRRLAESRVIELIPGSASHAWLPAVVDGPLMAHAQIGLAVADHVQTFNQRPEGVWLPHLAYRPDLEAAIGREGPRYFGVDARAFRRGTARPPHDLFGPLITRPGVAAFGVDTDLAASLRDAALTHRRDPSGRHPFDRGSQAVEHWLRCVSAHWPGGDVWPVSVVSLSIHELVPHGDAVDLWLEGAIERLVKSDARTTTPGAHLNRHPIGPIGRPGSSTGGWPTVQPGGSELLSRLLEAGDLLPELLGGLNLPDPEQARGAAQAIRALLLAQALDWSIPDGEAAGTVGGLRKASAWLDDFAELFGMVITDRVDLARLAELETGPTFLPGLDPRQLVPR